MVWQDNFLSGKLFGEHGNAWNDDLTGAGGFSNVVDTRNMPHISIMGEIDDNTEISFWASQDGIHFYYCDRITQTIVPITPGDPQNLAIDDLFGSDPEHAVGTLATLIADSGGFVQWNVGGDGAGVKLWYDFGSGVTINALEMMCEIGDRAPQQFVLEGSNDSATGTDGEWTTLYTQSTDLNWTSTNRRTFEIGAPASYEYYRITATKVANTERTRIDEVQLIAFGSGVPTGVFPKQFHIYPTVGGRYVRLRSSDDVTATITIAGKP